MAGEVGGGIGVSGCLGMHVVNGCLVLCLR